MTATNGGSTRGRPMRDIGALAVLVTARPALWWNNVGNPVPDTMEDLRRQARQRPTDMTAAIESNFARIFAWMTAAAASLALFIVVSFSRHLTSGAGDLTLKMVMATISWPCMAAAGMALPSSFRVSIAWGLNQWLRPLTPGKYPSMDEFRATRAVRERRGAGMAQRPWLWRFWLWFVTPSSFDLVTGLVVALLFAPLINADIPDFV